MLKAFWSALQIPELRQRVLFTLLVLAPLGFLLYAVAVRVGLEALVSLIRIAENTREIRDALRKEKA